MYFAGGFEEVSTWRLGRCPRSSAAALQEAAEVSARKKLQTWYEIGPFVAEKYIVKCQRGLPCMFGTGVCNPSRLEDHCPKTTSQSSVIALGARIKQGEYERLLMP